MAENPEPTPGAGAAEAAPAAAAKSKSSFIPLLIAVVAMPLMAVVTVRYIIPLTAAKAKPVASAEAPADSHGEEEKAKDHKEAKESKGSHGEEAPDKTKKTAKKSKDADESIILPLSGKKLELNADEDVVGEHEKIIVNIAGTGGTRYAVARISMLCKNKDVYKDINAKLDRLRDVASGTLAIKSLDEMEKPAFRNIVRNELLVGFNQVIKGGLIEDVIISEFLIQ
jgi:flagellar basal body-associated protein FliL